MYLYVFAIANDFLEEYDITVRDCGARNGAESSPAGSVEAGQRDSRIRSISIESTYRLSRFPRQGHNLLLLSVADEFSLAWKNVAVVAPSVCIRIS